MRRQIKSGIWILPALLILAVCTVRNPTGVIDEYPEIVSVETPVHIARLGQDSYPVYVRVSDPQGLDDILMVDMSIGEETGRTELTDGGNDPDLIPNDGVYTAVLKPNQFSSTGIILLHLRVIDLAGHQVEGLSDSIFVGETTSNGSPVLKDIQMPEQLESDSLGAVHFSVRIEDPQGQDDVDSAEIRIYPPLSAVPFYRVALRDDGTTGDIAPHDGIFSLTVNLSDTLRGLGMHQVRFQAWDRQGASSLPAVRPLFISGLNNAPVLSRLAARDTVNRQDTVPFLISVVVTDPQGIHDIKRVYFNSIKPDGSSAAGNPFILHDDGEAGDFQAGDGIYSLSIQISPQNELGQYTFTFYAEDLSGTVSEPLIHVLTVVDEGVN